LTQQRAGHRLLHHGLSRTLAHRRAAGIRDDHGRLRVRGNAQSAVSPATLMPLSISNGTTILVTLVVNGTVVETVAPGGHENPVKAALPSLPRSIETRSPSGRVLSRLTVNAGDVVSTTPDASGHSMSKGDAVRADLSCGRLDVWSGLPLLGPMFVPDPSKPCD
jgi:hypothetical protein